MTKTTRIQFTDKELKAILLLVGNSLEDGAEVYGLDPTWTDRLVERLWDARRRLRDTDTFDESTAEEEAAQLENFG